MDVEPQNDAPTLLRDRYRPLAATVNPAMCRDVEKSHGVSSERDIALREYPRVSLYSFRDPRGLNRKAERRGVASARRDTDS